MKTGETKEFPASVTNVIVNVPLRPVAHPEGQTNVVNPSLSLNASAVIDLEAWTIPVESLMMY